MPILLYNMYPVVSYCTGKLYEYSSLQWLLHAVFQSRMEARFLESIVWVGSVTYIICPKTVVVKKAFSVHKQF